MNGKSCSVSKKAHPGRLGHSGSRRKRYSGVGSSSKALSHPVDVSSSSPGSLETTLVLPSVGGSLAGSSESFESSPYAPSSSFLPSLGSHQVPPPSIPPPPLIGGFRGGSLTHHHGGGSLYSSSDFSSSSSFGSSFGSSGSFFTLSSTPNGVPNGVFHPYTVPHLSGVDGGSFSGYELTPPPVTSVQQIQQQQQPQHQQQQFQMPIQDHEISHVLANNVNNNNNINNNNNNVIADNGQSLENADFRTPPPQSTGSLPSGQSPCCPPIKAVVEKNGYVSFILAHNVIVDVAPNQAIRVHNRKQGVTLALSGCGTQMSLVHPQGRVLQYNSRIEMQGEDPVSIKNAKMWPKGVSFTANNCALVYLVDKAGVRSTSDSFFDLASNNTSDSMFLMSCSLSAANLSQAIYQCIENLRDAEYWRTEDELNCWRINGVLIKQTVDGLTTVERHYGNEKFILKTSPNNGKARLESSFLYVTASLGEEAHIFIKSEDRRLHYNGNSFQIRNGGHAAGFNEMGTLRIW